MADEESKIPENDDWLGDLDSEPEFTEVEDGLDASAFDEMFGELNPAEAVAAETVKAASAAVPAGEPSPPDASEPVAAVPESAVAEVAGQEDLGVELDQSSIDSLLNEDDKAPVVADSAAAAEVAIDQSSIDALLGGEDEPEAPAETAAPEPVADLPASEDLPPIPDINDDPDQAFAEEGDELDEIFGDAGGDALTLGDSGEDADSAFAEKNDGDTAAGSVATSESTAAPQSKPVSDFPDLMADTVLDQTAGKPAPRFNFAGLLADKKIMAIGGGVAAALIFVIIALIVRSGPEKPAVPRAKVAVESPAAVAPLPQPVSPVIVEKKVVPVPDEPPKAMPVQVTIPVDRDRVKLLLAGEGRGKGILNFEVVSLPAHGSLSGDPPNLTYTAGDDFSGRDSFAFRVTGSGGASEPALVEIGRARVSAAGVKIIAPRRPMFKMAAAKIKTTSTSGPVVIDGRKLWREINPGITLDKKAVLEVRGRPGHGRLKKVAPLVYQYIPDPYDRGIESFSYRFINRGFTSKRATLKIAVKNGNPPPDVRIAGFSAKHFRVGERVVLDAGPTRDDDRGNLKFRWLQNQGVDIRLERLNPEGSKVAFVVPSYFYTADYPEPVLTVEARDASGQVGREKIRIPVRRKSSDKDWDGLRLSRGRPGLDAGLLLPWAMASP